MSTIIQQIGAKVGAEFKTHRLRMDEIESDVSNKVEKINIDGGTVGSTTSIPVITYNDQGQIMTVSTAEIDMESEATARANADSDLGVRIDNILSNTDSTALNSLAEIVAAFQDADSNMDAAISQLASDRASALSDAVTALENADSDLNSSINTVIVDYNAADVILQNSINAEATARANADSDINASIDAVIEDYNAADVILQNSINSEITNRENADSDMTVAYIAAINAEAIARANADSDHTVSIQEEREARESADLTIVSELDSLSDGKVDKININPDVVGSSTAIPVITYNNQGQITASEEVAITVGDATITLTAGSGMTGGGNFTTNQTSNETITISHADTSTQGSLTALSGANVVSDVDVDGYGHVTKLSTRTMTLSDLGYTGATDANKYVHPTYAGDDIDLDTDALTGATVISDLDFNITTDTSGHVTDANATYSTRTLTLADLGYTGATNANYFTYTHPSTHAASMITTVDEFANSNSTNVQDVLDDIDAAVSLKAPIASPSFTGTPTAPTATAGTDTTQVATTAFVSTAISNLVGGAPGALDTLNELAAAINDDASYAASITASLGNKVDKTGVQALHATDALRVSGRTLSLYKGDGTYESITTQDTVYTHPTYASDDFSIDTGALTGATVISDLDINVTTDATGHVTDANATVATRTLTLADLGYTGATDANKYVHPTYNGDDFSIDTGALTGATVISDLDINVTTDGYGHVTDANATVATRTITLANLGYTGATNANYYVHPTYAGDDINLDTGTLTGATVISDLDFNVTTDTAGHVTDANATYATRTITYSDVGAAASSHTHTLDAILGAGNTSTKAMTVGALTVSSINGHTMDYYRINVYNNAGTLLN